MGTSGSTAPPKRSDTGTRILDLAQQMISQRGYNAVSYGDLAEELDLTTAAIHYHFPSKADLVQTLVRRYRRRSAEMRAALKEDHDRLRERLRQYVEVFSDIMTEGGLCLCGVLAADASTLPDEVRREVRQFFTEQEDWLVEIISAETTGGGSLQGCDSSRDAARIFLATIEGAMLTTPDRKPTVYTETLHHLIDSIVT